MDGLASEEQKDMYVSLTLNECAIGLFQGLDNLKKKNSSACDKGPRLHKHSECIEFIRRFAPEEYDNFHDTFVELGNVWQGLCGENLLGGNSPDWPKFSSLLSNQNSPSPITNFNYVTPKKELILGLTDAPRCGGSGSTPPPPPPSNTPQLPGDPPNNPAPPASTPAAPGDSSIKPIPGTTRYACRGNEVVKPSRRQGRPARVLAQSKVTAAIAKLESRFDKLESRVNSAQVKYDAIIEKMEADGETDRLIKQRDRAKRRIEKAESKMNAKGASYTEQAEGLKACINGTL